MVSVFIATIFNTGIIILLKNADFKSMNQNN